MKGKREDLTMSPLFVRAMRNISGLLRDSLHGKIKPTVPLVGSACLTPHGTGQSTLQNTGGNPKILLGDTVIHPQAGSFSDVMSIHIFFVSLHEGTRFGVLLKD